MMSEPTRIRCNNCMTVYLEYWDAEIFTCEECGTDEALMEDFIDLPEQRIANGAMPLLTREVRQRIPPLYSQENEKDPMVICKFFDPASSWTWYVIEGSWVDENGYCDTDKVKVDFLFFGLVIGVEPELSYFSRKELENAKQGLTGLRALPTERDIYFTPCRLSEIKKKHGII